MASDPKARIKGAIRLINQLKNIGPTSNARAKFIVDTTPFDDDEDSAPSSLEDWLVTGRLLPNSAIYKDGSVKINIKIGQNFPFKPPTVYIATPIYHPNVDKNGEVCLDLLSGNATWTPTSSLVTVIEEVTKIIDNPSTDHVKHPEAASLFDTNRKEYERIASETFQKHRGPRN